MRRTLSYLRAGAAPPPGYSGDDSKRARSKAGSLGAASKILTWDRYKPEVEGEGSVDDLLSAALVAQDNELASILQEVDRISKSLKSETVDTEVLSTTLERTVLCAVKQSLLDRELRSLALTDDLTGLHNRRAFLALAGQELRVTRRKAQGLLLFFADVDHLKDINDTYGHGEGDRALIRVADALGQTFRNSDVVARLGGDEFAVLALEASGEDREAILTRLDKNLKAASGGEPRYELSLSVGVVRFDSKRPQPLEKLIAMADEIMYQEKKNRRKVCAT